MLNLSQKLVLVLPLFALCGCRALQSPDPSVQLLESELRWMEDNLYALDDQLDRCISQLESSRRDNESLREELTRISANSSTARPAANSSQASSDEESGDGGFDVPSDDELLNLKSPVVDAGTPNQPKQGTDVEQQSDQRDAGPTNTPDGNDSRIKLDGLPDTQSLPSPKIDPGDASKDPFRSDEANVNRERVTRIVLNRRLTGGYDFDRESGHDGVMVVIEPQNVLAEYIPKTGPVEIGSA